MATHTTRTTSHTGRNCASSKPARTTRSDAPADHWGEAAARAVQLVVDELSREGQLPGESWSAAARAVLARLTREGTLPRSDDPAEYSEEGAVLALILALERKRREGQLPQPGR